MATSAELASISQSAIKEWKVISSTGTPAATVGDILQQIIKTSAGSVSTTWFNMTQSSLFLVAPVVSSLQENSQSTVNKPKNRWQLSTTTYLATLGTSATEKYAVIRNTNSFAVRIQSLELAMYTGKGYTSGDRLWYSLRSFIQTGVTALAGGTAQSVTKQAPGGIFSNDATIILSQAFTSVTSTFSSVVSSFYMAGTSDGASTSQPIAPFSSMNQKWAEGLVIPGGGSLTIEGSALASLTSNSYMQVACVLVEE